MIIAPSILAANPLELGREIKDVEYAGADWHHVDVMDGHFVNNLTFGLPILRALKGATKLPLDVHIMVTNPDQVALEYVKAGASMLVFHVEASQNPAALMKAIHAAGAKVGVALNPDSPLTGIEGLLDKIDMVNVMSVFPGFGGQAFIPESLEKIRTLKETLARRGLAEKVDIQVDGGIHDGNVKSIVDAGATVIVAGSYIYNSKDRRQQIAKLRQSAG